MLRGWAKVALSWDWAVPCRWVELNKADSPGFESYPCHSPALWSWAGRLSSLSERFLISKMGFV